MPELKLNKLQCTSCGEEFKASSAKAAKSAKSVHQRRCKAQVTVVFSNGPHTIDRNKDGVFVCQCNAQSYPHHYQTTKGIQDHAHKGPYMWVEREPAPSQPAPDMKENEGSEVNELATSLKLVHLNATQYLDQFEIKHNAVLNCLICYACKVAIVPAELVKHIQAGHQGSGHTINHASIKNALDSLNLLPKLPKMTSGPYPQISGLAVHTAMQCHACRAVYGKRSTMIKHYATDHKGVSVPDDWEEVSAQRLDNATRKTYFRITLQNVPAPPSNKAIISSLRKQQIAAVGGEPTGTRPDPRLLSSWLKLTRWTELTNGHNVATLIKLVAFPDKNKNEFPGLKGVVEHLYQSAEPLFDQFPELVLQRGINNTPFHRHQDHAATMKEYIQPVVCLLAMLLRLQEHPIFKYVLSTDTQKYLRILATSLTGENYHTHIVKTNTILVELWTTAWIKDSNTTFADPTMNLVALLMLCPDGSFKPPQDTTKPLAKLQYCMRLTFMIEIYRRSRLNGSAGITAEAGALAIWHVEHNDSTFNSVRSLQHRASTVAMSTFSLPCIWWKDRTLFNTLLYEGQPIEFGLLCRMFVAMERALINLWENIILCNTKLRISYGQLHDDLTNTEVGYSFMSDSRNPFAENRELLLEAMLQTPNLRKQFITGFNNKGEPMWNKVELRKWLVQYAAFEGLLLARATMLGGAPARMTEITGMTYKNTATTAHRNFLAFDRYIAMIVTYHKGSQLTGHDKLIPHAFDAITSDLLIQDLAIARPFAEIAANICFPTNKEVQLTYRDYLFVNNGKPFDTTNITTIMEQHSLPIVGRLEDLIEENEQETVEAQQASHSRKMENRIYALSDVSRTGVSEESLPWFLTASTDWQIETKTVPGGVGLAYMDARSTKFDDLARAGTFQLDSPSASTPASPPIDQLVAKLAPLLVSQMQEALLPAIGNMISMLTDITINNDEVPQGSKSTKNQQVAETQEQDDEIVLADTADISMTTALSQDESEDDGIEELFPPSSSTIWDNEDAALEDAHKDIIDQSYALQGLHKVMNSQNTTWTCDEQCDAVMASLEARTDVLAIMRTGSGKTMVALIPPSMEKTAVTVVVLPLLSLVFDYERRLAQMKIKFETYKSRHSIVLGTHRLILLTVDQFHKDHWQQTMKQIDHQRTIGRIIFDEAHYPLSNNGFREALENMVELRTVKCPVILLSGTIPPGAETEIQGIYGLRKDCVIIRTATDRPELEYIQPPLIQGGENVLQEAVRIYKLESATFQEQDRALIYVPFVDDGERLAELLDCDFYRGSKHLTGVEREAMHTNWIEGNHKVMVCTNAFSAGNDYSHVRLVIHAGSPFEMIGLVQEMSRAGRDYAHAKCYILCQKGRQQPELKNNDPDHCGRMAIWEMLYSHTECLRFSITLFHDGLGIMCGDAFKCSRCAKQYNVTKARTIAPLRKRSFQQATASFAQPVLEAKQHRVERISLKMDYVIGFLERLEHFAHICAFCSVFGYEEEYHNILVCKTLNQRVDGADGDTFKQWKRSIRWSAGLHGTVCYFCHIPQVNDTLHGTIQPGGANCKHPDILPPIAFAVFYSAEHKKMAEQHFQTTWSTESAFSAWLVGRPLQAHKTNMVALFFWYTNLNL
ncbi:hypothetical protein DXG01_009772 [Tephrocybe rancida]|nr:hypothetical protein DXG01_009772 [Tephrocybe rancida]